MVKLNSQQKEALPHLMWILNPNIARGSGRSYLLAHVCIELAKQGLVLELKELGFDKHRTGLQFDRHFAEQVLILIKDHYPEDEFYFNWHTFEFRYIGPKDASIRTGTIRETESKIS